MPEIDGFDVLASIPLSKIPFVIFVTAYDQYALRAFEVSAVDYLVKPFDRRRFEKGSSASKARLASERDIDLNQQTLALLEELKAKASHVERLVIKSGDVRFF
jgi:two-component system LytT family response regulator